MIQSAVKTALERLKLPHNARLHMVINDPDRSTPTRVVLDALRALRPDLEFEGTVACGTHHHTEAQRQEHIERHGLGGFHMLRWSEPSQDEEIPPDRPVLAVGSVEPHWFAGWTGAHKTLTVGLWSRERIEANHAFALSPEALPARLDGNPLFDDIAQQLGVWLEQRAAPVAAVNLLADYAGIHAARGGGVLSSVRALVDAARAHYVEVVPVQLDRLIARVEPPLDRSFYQASKGIKNNTRAVRDGGAIVLVADCVDGVGIDHFMRLMSCGSYTRACEDVERRGYVLGDHKAIRLRYVMDERGLKLAIVAPEFPAEAAQTLGLTCFTDEDAARDWARQVAPGSRERVLEDAAQRVLMLG